MNIYRCTSDTNTHTHTHARTHTHHTHTHTHTHKHQIMQMWNVGRIFYVLGYGYMLCVLCVCVYVCLQCASVPVRLCVFVCVCQVVPPHA